MTEIDNVTVMTVSEVAEFLRIAESTVYKLAQGGQLPGRKIGGMWRFSRKEVEALLAEPDSGSEEDDSSLEADVP